VLGCRNTKIRRIVSLPLNDGHRTLNVVLHPILASPQPCEVDDTFSVLLRMVLTPLDCPAGDED
jgi:hypothetical protein